MATRTLFTILNHKTKTLTANAILARTRTYCFKSNPVKRNNLHSRINSIGDPSCSVAPVLQQWVKEGKNVNEFQLQPIIRDLRARRRYSHALEVSKWMSSSDLKFSSSDCAVQLDLIGRVHGLRSAENFFCSMKDQDKTVQTYGALLNCYVREGLIDESLSLMKKMREMGFLSSPLNYNNLMCLYTNVGQLEKVPDVLLEMKMNGVSPDMFSYRICINSYGARADYNSMEKVLQEMESQQNIEMDWGTYSVVANHYIKAGLNEKALHYLKECEKKVGKNALGYDHLISMYASLGNLDEMKLLWGLLKAKCKKHTNINYIRMLGSLMKLGELEESEKLLKKWESSCKTYDFRVPNVLLIGYCQKGLVEKAEAVLQDIIKRRKTALPNSWSIVAAGYVNKNNIEKAFECFREALALQAENKDWRPKASLISSILSWLGDNGEVEDAEAFVKLLRTKVPANRDMYHALLKAYIRNGKEVEGLLERMKDDEIGDIEETMKILSLREQRS
ncbi:pentatricopeptide repeat-containing protein At4g21705, mitochondrial-like [Durio zibethinus]|uniref:Pentatricopeptide repeat-containing protein At4g21705, mitochondrial-like n=1 Tax=Durio zibethinus TaxID=66656 RepID=A0A6P5XZM6_DURZI|nr:pentatricopeptide repeat-containing protein At4g21705, mitochondrial-like [Durio zibethinus]